MVLDEFFNINPTLNYGNNTQRKIEINNIPF